MPGVVSVFPNLKRRLHTTHSWDFMGLVGEETMEIPGFSTKNQVNVIVGFIDTGQLSLSLLLSLSFTLGILSFTPIISVSVHKLKPSFLYYFCTNQRKRQLELVPSYHSAPYPSFHLLGSCSSSSSICLYD